MTGVDVPSRADLEDLMVHDTTLQHCDDVRSASGCMTYEDMLRMAVDLLVREKAWWRDRAMTLSSKRGGGA